MSSVSFSSAQGIVRGRLLTYLVKDFLGSLITFKLSGAGSCQRDVLHGQKRSSSPKTERVDGVLRSIIPFTDLSLRTLTVDRDSNGIVVVSFDVPDRSLNVLTREVLEELAYVLDHIQNTAPTNRIGACVGTSRLFFAARIFKRLTNCFRNQKNVFVWRAILGEHFLQGFQHNLGRVFR